MAKCPTCGKIYEDSPSGCPYCVPQPAQFGPEHDMRLVSVYRANDELSAHLIHDILVNNGVPAHIHSEQAPMFGTLLQMDHGCWGEVMVPEPLEVRALEIVKVFTTSDPESDARLEEEALLAGADPDAPADSSAESTADPGRATGDSSSTPGAGGSVR
jgi:hypothetical protein